MELIAFIIWLVIVGAVFGALGRLAVPGPNPMGMGMTILVGLVGAFLGGIVGLALGAPSLVVIILQVLGAAAIVYLMQRRRPIRTY